MKKIYSVSAVIGEKICDVRCDFCGGKGLKNTCSHNKDRRLLVPELGMKKAIELCSKYGGWSLSLTSSGEPTKSPESVTQALNIHKSSKDKGNGLPFTTLFTNGLRIGSDKDFCNKYLPIWKELELDTIAVSVQSIRKEDIKKLYGVDQYPDLKDIVDNIHAHGLQARATLLLRKGYVDTPAKFKKAIEYLFEIGFDTITSWAIVNPDGGRSSYTPSILNILKIRFWLFKYCSRVLGHPWFGAVYTYKEKTIRFTNYVSKHKANSKEVRQLVVFQDGRVSYSWFQKGFDVFKY